MSFVSDFEPKKLWKHFDEILTIPRGSKQEDRIREYVLKMARENGMKHRTDAAGNVVVEKPATAGREKAPAAVLQAHMDMVNEKNSDVEHDFDTDPIQPRRDGDYLTASGTTLGSDNGIGLAAMLAILESDDLIHGPLELLFTVDEETGLTGANQLDAGMIKGRRLVNLDSEEEGALYVGCAGGLDSHLTLPLEVSSPPPGSAAIDVKLAGLKGGHSGVDIHLQRGNATKLLVRALHAQLGRTPFQLAALSGGNKHNAIPREAFATVIVRTDAKESFLEALKREVAAIQEELRPAEPSIRFDTSEAEMPAQVWTSGTTEKALSLIQALPHGVLAMSYDIPGLVETSTNLATVGEQDGKLAVSLSSRSSVNSALGAVAQRIRATASLAGAEAEEGSGYPGWKPNMDSAVLKLTQTVHRQVVGTDPEIKAIHAGLECGIIGEKLPGMDMISMGPQIEFPHSPDERVKIDSVERFYNLLTATLEAAAT